MLWALITVRRKLDDALDYGRSLQPIHDLQPIQSSDVSSDDVLVILDVSEIDADAQPKKVTVGALGGGISAVDSVARASGNAALAIALPSGGTTGQVAAKASASGYDVVWATAVLSDIINISGASVITNCVALSSGAYAAIPSGSLSSSTLYIIV